MAAYFSTHAFLAELENFGQPPPQQKLVHDETTSVASAIASKLNAINLEKQKKIRGEPHHANNGMVTLGSKLNEPKKEEITLTDVEKWRQQVINANRPKNVWLEQQSPSPESSKEYARSVARSTNEFDCTTQTSDGAHSRSSTATGSLPSPPGNSVKYSDYSSASSYKSSSPPSTYTNNKDYYNPYKGPKGSHYVNSLPNHKFAPGYTYGHGTPTNNQNGNGLKTNVTVVPQNPYQHGGYIPSTAASNGGKQQDVEDSKYTSDREKEKFPKVDIMSSPCFTSPPNTSDYGTARLPPYLETKGNGNTNTGYGRQDVKPQNRSRFNRSSPSSEARAARWRGINTALGRSDEQFGRLSEQIADDMEREQRSKVKVGHCASCLDVLYASDDVTIAMDRKYHPRCFKCESCGKNLRDKQFFLFEQKILCKEDFLVEEIRKKAEKCAACQQPIVEMVLRALEKSFHPLCFKCVICSKGLDGVPFAIDNKHQVYCMPDYHEKFAPRCASCAKGILPNEGTGETVRVVARNKDYHVECYVCEECKCQLTDDSSQRCYPLGDHLLCISCHRLWKSTGGAPTTDL